MIAGIFDDPGDLIAIDGVFFPSDLNAVPFSYFGKIADGTMQLGIVFFADGARVRCIFGFATFLQLFQVAQVVFGHINARREELVEGRPLAAVPMGAYFNTPLGGNCSHNHELTRICYELTRNHRSLGCL